MINRVEHEKCLITSTVFYFLDGSSSACLTISQETQKKSVDNFYITPNDYIPGKSFRIL